MPISLSLSVLAPPWLLACMLVLPGCCLVSCLPACVAVFCFAVMSACLRSRFCWVLSCLHAYVAVVPGCFQVCMLVLPCYVGRFQVWLVSGAAAPRYAIVFADVAEEETIRAFLVQVREEGSGRPCFGVAIKPLGARVFHHSARANRCYCSFRVDTRGCVLARVRSALYVGVAGLPPWPCLSPHMGCFHVISSLCSLAVFPAITRVLFASIYLCVVAFVCRRRTHGLFWPQCIVHVPDTRQSAARQRHGAGSAVPSGLHWRWTGVPQARHVPRGARVSLHMHMFVCCIASQHAT